MWSTQCFVYVLHRGGRDATLLSAYIGRYAALRCARQAFKGDDVTRRDGSRFFLSQRLLAPAAAAAAAAAASGSGAAAEAAASPAQRALAQDAELRQWLKQLVVGLQKSASARDRVCTQEDSDGRVLWLCAMTGWEHLFHGVAYISAD